MILLLAACTSGTLTLGGDPPPADADETSAETIGDAPEQPDPPPDVGLGTATLTCAAPPPTDGKTECSLQVLGADGTSWWDGPVGVGLHGRSSSSFPKPQLAVELHDTGGAKVSADLLGMGGEADWLLNGMWIDRALMRNKLAYDLFRELTGDREWAPESAYVELTYNGGYYGIYALCERVDRDGGRLDIPLDDGTGASFIVKASEAGIPSSLQYGAWEVLYPTATADVNAGVGARLAEAEALMRDRDPALWDVVDLDSAVAFVLIEETVKNNDGYFLSHHVYTATDGKLHFTPWDLDLSLGQPSYNDNENPRSWIAYRSDLVSGMAGTPGFSERMASTWAEWRAAKLATDAIDARIDGIVATLGVATDRNFDRWPIEEVDFSGYLYRVGSYEEEIGRVHDWIDARLVWMDDNVADYAE